VARPGRRTGACGVALRRELQDDEVQGRGTRVLTNQAGATHKLEG
jgi:hypothetical protein